MSACGPVALVNALELGDAASRKALAAIGGASGLAKAQTIIQEAAKPSADYKSGVRVRPDGVSCADLCDIEKNSWRRRA